MPVPGTDYPRTLEEFEEFFPDEVACRRYLMRLRWREGYTCRACGAVGVPWVKKDGQFRCRLCRVQTSAIAGTIFQDTRKPLRMWFHAMWHITSQKQGVSALGLQRVLGLGSYESAWAWLHKLRRAMVRSGRDRLTGVVQVDETFVGGATEGRRGRGTSKAIVVVAAEENGLRIGRIRLKSIPDASAESLMPFVQEVVEVGSTVHTDGWEGYSSLEKLGYKHMTTRLTGKHISAAHVLMPHVHRVSSLLKRWLIGTHQGAVQESHLDYYLDEFTFRFNRRTSKSRGLLFYRLLEQAVVTEPAPYKALIIQTQDVG
ncbi:MAG: IS1595 family transposase [Candidatus Xenobiia bacterium LiM19]